MGQNPTETGPIEEESSVVEQSIVEATIILQEVIDEYPHGIDIHDLKLIMQNLRDAYTAFSVEEIVNPVFTVADKIQAAKIDEDDGSCEGEIQAEAEAERRADAALELSAELASCDWGAWE